MQTTKEKNRYSEFYKKVFLCRPEISLKDFEKLKPEPGRARPETLPHTESPARLTTLYQITQI